MQMVQVKLTKPHVLVGNRVCAEGDVVDVDLEVAIRFVESVAGEFVDARLTQALQVHKDLPREKKAEAVAALVDMLGTAAN
ncbi:hypothetical protein [Singulisphaera acidiphila]|uniref:Uncharacterized protein n=1 Tax=Singulisphaera acidiphila (strain ATCC BAA-1392 / DSM 18658 / VKM B-2454 / MOB10) TaxID=886293 RepID=L0DIP5_SINAD|nr:hypothetical protein [Singulisphaera acidiphila]AGA28725.1 hypothetical protein Sinac_4544 [Singulisphaera acidiphila DSM 18658]